MKNLSKEIKIAIMVVGATIVMFIGFRYMKDVPLFRTANKIITVFPKVTGLNAGNQVLVRGVKVGTVSEVQLTNNDSVKVVMSIENKFTIPKGSTAQVQSLDLLGTKAVVINRGNGVEEVPYGARIKGIYEEGVIDQLSDKGAELSSSVTKSITELETLLANLNNILNKNNQQQIDSVITNFKGASSTIAQLINEKQGEITRSISLIENILHKVDTLSSLNKQKIDSVLQNLEYTSASFKKISGQMEYTITDLDEIVQKLNEGEGTMGQLINNPSVYQNVDSLTFQLQKMVKKMNDDPRYFLKHMKIVDMF